MRARVSCKLSETPWTCVDMESRRAPELACMSCTDFCSELIVPLSLFTESSDCSISVFSTAPFCVSAVCNLLLALNQLVDALLQFHDFACHRSHGRRPQQSASQGASQHRGSQVNDPSFTHAVPP